MARFTPTLDSKGKYTLRAPWSANPNVLYTCKALRAFDDIYKTGKDVYKTYYVPMGVTNGSTTFTPTPFSFEEERRNNVVIVTLIGDDGNVIFIPDSFISTQPDVTEVKYSHIVLSASIGAVPDTVDLSAIKTSIANMIQASLGVLPTVQESRLPSINNPTPTQHTVMENARTGSIVLNETDKIRAERLQVENGLLQSKIATLTQILRDNNLLP